MVLFRLFSVMIALLAVCGLAATETKQTVVLDNADAFISYDAQESGLAKCSKLAAESVLRWIETGVKLAPAARTAVIDAIAVAAVKGKFFTVKLKANDSSFIGAMMKMLEKSMISGDVYTAGKRKGYFALGIDKDGNPTKNPY